MNNITGFIRRLFILIAVVWWILGVIACGFAVANPRPGDWPAALTFLIWTVGFPIGVYIIYVVMKWLFLGQQQPQRLAPISRKTFDELFK